MTDELIPVLLRRSEWHVVEDMLCASVASMHAISSQALPGLNVIEAIDVKTQEVHSIVGAIKRATGPTMETLA